MFFFWYISYTLIYLIVFKLKLGYTEITYELAKLQACSKYKRKGFISPLLELVAVIEFELVLLNIARSVAENVEHA